MRIAVAGATGLVGRRLTDLARSEGHEVVELARSTGIDLVDGTGLDDALAGVAAVVDVTQSPAPDQQPATDFFTTVATHLGRAAARAGVRRTLVLSIVGADRSPDYGYYVAKVAQEHAHRTSSPGPVVLRSTQFHEFAEQVLGWSSDGRTASVIDVRIQPIDVAEVVRLLLDLATGARSGDTEVAGPRVESLVEQARELVLRSGSRLEVVPVPGPASLASGSALPGADAEVRGISWREWLDRRQETTGPQVG